MIPERAPDSGRSQESMEKKASAERPFEKPFERSGPVR
jgi:hypothetical protein